MFVVLLWRTHLLCSIANSFYMLLLRRIPFLFLIFRIIRCYYCDVDTSCLVLRCRHSSCRSAAYIIRCCQCGVNTRVSSIAAYTLHLFILATCTCILYYCGVYTSFFIIADYFYFLFLRRRHFVFISAASEFLCSHCGVYSYGVNVRRRHFTFIISACTFMCYVCSVYIDMLVCWRIYSCFIIMTYILIYFFLFVIFLFIFLRNTLLFFVLRCRQSVVSIVAYTRFSYYYDIYTSFVALRRTH